MARCGITSGIRLTCDDQKRVGGVNKRIYVFNKTSSTGAKVTFTTGSDGYITTINFPDSYDGLMKFEGKKRSHSGGWEKQDNPGGSTLFNHTVIAKIFNTDPDDDAVIEDLTSSDIVVILETGNQELIMYGIENGMELTVASNNTGTEGSADTSTTLTFVGQEKELPKRFKRISFTDSINYLESIVA